MLLEQVWNLGVPFRAVIRREVLTGIPATPGDAFADQVWVFGMALRRHLRYVPEALYLKRYHARNTHQHWTPPSSEQRHRELMERVSAAFPDGGEGDPVRGFIDQMLQLRRRRSQRQRREIQASTASTQTSEDASAVARRSSGASGAS